MNLAPQYQHVYQLQGYTIKFEADGSVQNVNNGYTERPHSSTDGLTGLHTISEKGYKTMFS
jgi:hypothetical protein